MVVDQGCHQEDLPNDSLFFAGLGRGFQTNRFAISKRDNASSAQA